MVLPFKPTHLQNIFLTEFVKICTKVTMSSYTAIMTFTYTCKSLFISNLMRSEFHLMFIFKNFV